MAAMPSSGQLFLCDPHQVGNCRSIAHAVYGTPIGAVNLCAAGQAIGCSLPIRHSCFYGYAPAPVGVAIGYDMVRSGSVAWFDGVVRLRLTSNNAITSSRFIPFQSVTDSHSFPTQSAGSYYLDLSGVVAYDFSGNAIIRIMQWSWENSAGVGISDFTNSVSSSDWATIIVTT